MSDPSSDQPGAPLRRGEFVPLLAALMALGAIGVDAMLPALPAIGHQLGVADPNRVQLVVSAYVVGFGVGQLIHGPVADRFGRRPAILGALIGYVGFSLACASTASFDMLLAARFLAGTAAAASRVVAVALVRDCFHGRAMGQVMSLAFMVFMVAPILAPSLGQAVLVAGSWRLIFAVIAATGVVVGAWFAWRMPETLALERRLPLSVKQIASSYAETLRDRYSLGYTIAAAVLQGALFGYINSIQQIVSDVFSAPRMLGVVFAACAGLMAVANLLNSRLVMRLGMRRISHTALLVLIATATLDLAIQARGMETLFSFVLLQAILMACFGLVGSNFSTMAMENMGAIAGSASSVQGFIAAVGGALIGTAIGLAFDGTTQPMHAGFLIAGLVCLAITFVVERGKLFRPL